MDQGEIIHCLLSRGNGSGCKKSYQKLRMGFTAILVTNANSINEVLSVNRTYLMECKITRGDKFDLLKEFRDDFIKSKMQLFVSIGRKKPADFDDCVTQEELDTLIKNINQYCAYHDARIFLVIIAALKEEDSSPSHYKEVMQKIINSDDCAEVLERDRSAYENIFKKWAAERSDERELVSQIHQTLRHFGNLPDLPLDLNDWKEVRQTNRIE